jgi:hypothetical protein
LERFITWSRRQRCLKATTLPDQSHSSLRCRFGMRNILINALSDYFKVYDLAVIPALAHVLSLLFDCLDPVPQVILAVTQRRRETIDFFVESLGI